LRNIKKFIGGFAMAIYLLVSIILAGLAVYIVVSVRGIQKSRSEIDKLFE
jgi:hypothetical protein